MRSRLAAEHGSGGIRGAGDLAEHQPVRHRPGTEPVWGGVFGVCRHPVRAGKAARAGAIHIPLLADIPFLGTALFRQHPLVYVAMAVAAGLVWFLSRTRAGLVLRSVGESPESAHALGYTVRRIRRLLWWWAARCAGWRGRMCPPSTHRCGSIA